MSSQRYENCVKAFELHGSTQACVSIEMVKEMNEERKCVQVMRDRYFLA